MRDPALFKWCYFEADMILYRAVDSTGATLDFRLSASRDAGAAVTITMTGATGLSGLPIAGPRLRRTHIIA
jgi:hypothetical protein